MVTPSSHGMNDELTKLRASLQQIQQQKEQLYQKKEESFSKVKDILTQLRSIKHKIDASKAIRDDLRKKRDEQNAIVKSLAQQLKELSNEKEKALKNSIGRINPERLKQQIAYLDTKIETEALSMDQEKKVMKKIKEHKHKIQAAQGVDAVFAKIRDLRTKLKESRDCANDYHQRLQTHIQQHRSNIDLFKELVKKIDELRKEKNSYVAQFLQSREQFFETNKALRNKLGEYGKARQQKNFENKRRIEEILREKEKIVEEKIKARKKLTTEDLLVFQKQKI